MNIFKNFTKENVGVANNSVFLLVRALFSSQPGFFYGDYRDGTSKQVIIVCLMLQS